MNKQELEKKLRDKAGKDADRIIAEVMEDPHYFVMEGGSDGTFSHIRFHNEYGHLMPEISDFAVKCGGRV